MGLYPLLAKHRRHHTILRADPSLADDMGREAHCWAIGDSIDGMMPAPQSHRPDLAGATRQPFSAPIVRPAMKYRCSAR